jgi:prepilin-type N-terminal cleavage/methylation domain-containing protein
MVKQNAGFTLVELMVAVAIVAIMLGMAVPAVNAYLTRHGLQYASDELWGDIQLARMRAARNNQRCRISFDSPGPGQYQIDDVDNNNVVIRTFKISDLTKFRGGITFTNSPNAADGAPLESFEFTAQGIIDQVQPAGSNAVYLTNQDNDPFFRVVVSLAGGTGIGRWIPAQNQWR